MNFIKRYGRCTYAKVTSEPNLESNSGSDENSPEEPKINN